ncbi:hypothetical protein Bhyg_02690 [Pseudolycoriella hygida]|uniref:Uncharacterized protein n=1 Tax=Pseudolycoriella hygida TaxID=35572 RepID=A0A9Q0S6R8_9DIPT|nr:hypothetical protein Bhyg_02690 [Pseudolycoriella hygida]
MQLQRSKLIFEDIVFVNN